MANIHASLEALLFIYGEPIEIKKIVKILHKQSAAVDEAMVRTTLEDLKVKFSNEDRGLMLVTTDDRVQIVTKGEFSELLQEIVKEELNESLTPAALETLAIIAYTSPVSRALIDYIRGVNSTFILRALLLRGLVQRFEDPKRANAYLYKPSFELLKHLDLGKPEDLPEYQRFRDVVAKLKVED